MPISTHRLLSAALLVFAAALTGCSSKKPEGPSDSVSGKVTLNGQPVAGQVIFVGADKKEHATLIAADGAYTLANPPKGEVVVLVRALGVSPPASGAGPKMAGPKMGGPMPGGGGPKMGGPMPGGGGPLPGAVPGGDDTFKGKTEAPPMAASSSGVPPPAKYSTVAGGLKFTVTGGHQTYNIELQP